jgi:hypothetical protein
VSPTVFRHKGYRFFFFSREEERPHIHVECADGEAKFWVDPVKLVRNYGLSAKQLREVARIIEERQNEIKNSWEEHFER